MGYGPSRPCSSRSCRRCGSARWVRNSASFMAHEKEITVFSGEPQPTDTAPFAAALLSDFGSPRSLTASGRFQQRIEPSLSHLFAGEDLDRCFACALASYKAPMIMHIREQVQHRLIHLATAGGGTGSVKCPDTHSRAIFLDVPAGESHAPPQKYILIARGRP